MLLQSQIYNDSLQFILQQSYVVAAVKQPSDISTTKLMLQTFIVNLAPFSTGDKPKANEIVSIYRVDGVLTMNPFTSGVQRVTLNTQKETLLFTTDSLRYDWFKAWSFKVM